MKQTRTTNMYQKVLPALKKELGIENVMALPKVEKVVVNSGVGRAIKDEKLLDMIVRELTMITGQKPVLTKAKQSIANFKTREGMVVGVKVTLRGSRMYDFISRLVNIALPRTRDFRGFDQRLIDAGGNLTIGIKEHIVFPEILTEDIRNIFGFEVTIVVKVRSKAQALALYRALGFPIK